ncbi:MAG: pantoate--beta-alanine ligase [Planctomycetes bacterium]|nr:pantoate--beta-alanine ligase [Planctomycetota bacterium]
MLVVHAADELAPAHGGALVPTMGALHAGHLALIRRAKETGGRVVVSLFVNPTQFAPGEDHAKYPRRRAADVAAAEEAGAEIVFAPEVETVYPTEAEVAVPPLPPVAIDPGLEDACRPGHLAGVCQVVARLFDLVRPAHAIFGEKDFQQLLVIGAMTARATERWPGLEIIAHPTVREPDGLAMSSRNEYLAPDERARALGLFEALHAARSETRPDRAEERMRSVLEGHALEVDYAVVRDRTKLMPLAEDVSHGRALIAARLGAVRLIDNMAWG